ncbi:hypothetical protein TNCV_895271 [Trichonephila clavipes]|nr:hypothetical protein TNCV_895271 [Trichonephila clavipes]
MESGHKRLHEIESSNSRATKQGQEVRVAQMKSGHKRLHEIESSSSRAIKQGHEEYGGKGDIRASTACGVSEPNVREIKKEERDTSPYITENENEITFAKHIKPSHQFTRNSG